MSKKIVLVFFVIIFLVVFALFFFDGPPDVKQPPEGLSKIEYKEWIANETYTSLYNKETINFGYKEPTQKELDGLKQQVDLTRKYPSKINALFEIGSNTTTLVHFSDELKDLGVNTYVVQAEVEYKDGELRLFQPGYTSMRLLSQDEAKRIIIHRMLLAKQAGFAVSFVPDYPSLFDLGKTDFYDVNLSANELHTLEPKFIALALEWAKIAEEYGLEYFAPINEYEKLLESNGYDLNSIYQKTNAFYSKLIPELRKVYSGKIIIKTGHLLGNWENHKNLSFKDADLVGVGVYYALSAENISRDISDMVRVMDEISLRDNTPWLITEYYAATPDEIDRFFPGDSVKIPVEETYKAGLSEFTKSSRAAGFTFTGYIGGGKIRGTPAVSVLKDFFASQL